MACMTTACTTTSCTTTTCPTTVAAPVPVAKPATAEVPARGILRRSVRIVAALFGWLTARPVVLVDPALEVLIVRRDDRLLEDAGLTPEDAMGRWRHFRERELETMLGRRYR